MATVIIDTRSNEAKKMLEFLKSTRYARVVEEDVPNKETLEAMNEVEEGQVNSYKSSNELMRSLKKAASLPDKDIQ